MLTLILGGARSGKSALALRLAARNGTKVTFIATGEAGDGEMAERIANHRAERPSTWETVEAPLKIEAALMAAPTDAPVVLDCLTLWASNALEELGPAEAEAAAKRAADAARDRDAPTIVVSNEVGMGLVSENRLGRAYRDLLGRINAVWAAAAHDVLLVVAGRTLRLTETEEILGELR